MAAIYRQRVLQGPAPLATSPMASAYRAAPGPLVAVVLAALLMVTTPVGTGGGVHQFNLVHPLFAHVHIYDGRILTHEQLAETLQPSPPRTHSPGPALGAGSASASAEAGLALSPTVPVPPTAVLAGTRAQTFETDLAPPRGRVEAPPDPPPTA
jgi:hypothetical protein